MTVASTILQQLGGNKFIAMTGAKNLLDCGNGLRMDLTRNKSKANILVIRLNDADQYDMEFMRYKPSTCDVAIVAKFGGVYADQLQDVFTDTTGLQTRIGGVR